jgi:hypothetical protein
MTKCDNCGRDDGHWIGCPASFTDAEHASKLIDADAMTEEDWEAIAPRGICMFGGCTDPKRPAGKGPKPKFCTEHSDPKNRK